MASIIRRLRKRTPQTESIAEEAPSTNPITGDAEKMIAELNDHEKRNLELSKPGDSTIPHGGGGVVEDEDLPADVKELPVIVRNTVSLEDDPTLPTITFRYFLLCVIFIPPGAILFQMGAYRTTAAVYPVLFVQIGK